MTKRLLIIDGIVERRVNILDSVLAAHYAAEGVANPAAAMESLRKTVFDLIVLNSNYDEHEEERFFGQLQEDAVLRWVPVIVTTRHDGAEQKNKYFSMGASDVLGSPFAMEDLMVHIENLLQRAGHMEEMAFRDALTNVYNRKYFDQRIQDQLRRSQAADSPISLAFIDADHFKAVNDRYGHHAGDMVLKGLAELIQRRVEPADIVARYGGEEFVVLMPGTTREVAYQRIFGILEAARKLPVAQDGQREYFITFSGGVCQWVPNWSVEQWIKMADDAAYQAKRNGRNQIVCHGMTKTTNTKQVLVVGQAQANAVLQIQALPIKTMVVSTPEECAAIVQSKSIDLCILPAGSSAFSILPQTRAVETPPKVIIVSETYNQLECLECLKQGVDHYIGGSMSLIDLEASIRNLLDLSFAEEMPSSNQ